MAVRERERHGEWQAAGMQGRSEKEGEGKESVLHPYEVERRERCREVYGRG